MPCARGVVHANETPGAATPHRQRENLRAAALGRHFALPAGFLCRHGSDALLPPFREGTVPCEARCADDSIEDRAGGTQVLSARLSLCVGRACCRLLALATTH